MAKVIRNTIAARARMAPANWAPPRLVCFMSATRTVVGKPGDHGESSGGQEARPPAQNDSHSNTLPGGVKVAAIEGGKPAGLGKPGNLPLSGWRRASRKPRPGSS